MRKIVLQNLVIYTLVRSDTYRVLSQLCSCSHVHLKGLKAQFRAVKTITQQTLLKYKISIPIVIDVFSLTFDGVLRFRTTKQDAEPGRQLPPDGRHMHVIGG